jgi:hypothetical protein
MPLALRKSTATREQIGPTTRPTHIQKTSLFSIPAVPIRNRKFPAILALDRSYSVFAAGTSSRRRNRLFILSWKKKLSRTAGSTPAHAAQDMATNSCCGNSCLRRIENFQAAQRFRTAARRCRMITDYWFLVVLRTCWLPCALPPPLASLVGFRSRTSTCGLSFFSSLILPFLVC